MLRDLQQSCVLDLSVTRKNVAGGTAFDASKQKLTGTLNGGVTVVPGGFGMLEQGWQFAGNTSQSINLANDLFAGLQKLTVSILLSPSNVDTTQHGVFSCTSGSTAHFDAIIGVFNAGDIFFRIGQYDNDYVCTGAGAVSTNATYLISFVFDGAQTGITNKLQVYVNGVQQSLPTTGGGSGGSSIPSASVPTLLGRYYDNGANNKPFSGQILFADAVQAVQAGPQLSALYNALRTGEPSNITSLISGAARRRQRRRRMVGAAATGTKFPYPLLMGRAA